MRHTPRCLEMEEAEEGEEAEEVDAEAAAKAVGRGLRLAPFLLLPVMMPQLPSAPPLGVALGNK